MSSRNITHPNISLVYPVKDIKSLKPGQKGWTHMWAIFKDAANQLWVRNYSVYEKESERVNLHILKENDGSITIDASHIDHREWDMLTRSENISGGKENLTRANAVLH